MFTKDSRKLRSRFRDKNRDFSDSPQLFRFSATFPILRNFRNFSDFPRFTATFNVFPENVHVLLSKLSDLSLKYAVEQKINKKEMSRCSDFSRFRVKNPILRNFFDSRAQLFRF